MSPLTQEMLDEVKWVSEHPLKLDYDLVDIGPILRSIDWMHYLAKDMDRYEAPTRESVREDLTQLREVAQEIVNMIYNIL